MNRYHLALLRAIEQLVDGAEYETALRGLLEAVAALGVRISPDEISERLWRNITLHLWWARYETARTPEILEKSPAQELVSKPGYAEPINWQEQWSAQGGNIFAGRMIALKSDLIWQRISEFGYPFPPFARGSSMILSPVARDEAVELGLMAQGAVINLCPIRRPTQVI